MYSRLSGVSGGLVISVSSSVADCRSVALVNLPGRVVARVFDWFAGGGSGGTVGRNVVAPSFNENPVRS